jgi:hypothetical protein
MGPSSRLVKLIVQIDTREGVTTVSMAVRPAESLPVFGINTKCLQSGYQRQAEETPVIGDRSVNRARTAKE